MPWALLLRLLGVLAFASFMRRMRAGGSGVRKPQIDKDRLRVRVLDASDDAKMASRFAAGLGLAGGALLATVVSVTLLVTGPRWLGAVCSVATLVLIAASAVELRRATRDVQTRRWRHRKIVITESDTTTQAH